MGSGICKDHALSVKIMCFQDANHVHSCLVPLILPVPHSLISMQLRSSRYTEYDLCVRSARRNAELNGYAEDAFCVLQCGQSLDDAEPVQQVRASAMILSL
eukprot:scaffold160243_cov24-Tisochrysis_lutea.AAC.1